MGKDHSLIHYVKDRPGHDLRYAINANKIRSELGLEAEIRFPFGIKVTISWYLDNIHWLDSVASGDYRLTK